MDVNELNVQLDQKIAGMVKEAGKGLILVVTKWDDAQKKTPSRSTSWLRKLPTIIRSYHGHR
jgi:predicted GTPase